ncbi:MAG: terminase small subunit [Bacteroidota bacterium]
MKLTIKQENFCNFYIESGNASDAYRRAYDCGRMKDVTINRTSFDLLNDHKITARVNELRATLQANSDITKESNLAVLKSIIDDTKEAKAIRIKAIEVSNKMLGFDAPTKTAQTDKNGNDLITELVITIDRSGKQEFASNEKDIDE